MSNVQRSLTCLLKFVAKLITDALEWHFSPPLCHCDPPT